LELFFRSYCQESRVKCQVVTSGETNGKIKKKHYNDVLFDNVQCTILIMNIDMKTSKKQPETIILDVSKDMSDDMFRSARKTLEYSAAAIEILVRACVKFQQEQDCLNDNLPLTHTVRIRLHNTWDVKYLLIGLPRTSVKVPDVGLIRLSARDSFFIYAALRRYFNNFEIAARMADLAGKEFEMPDLEVNPVSQPSQKLRRHEQEGYIYHPIDINKVLFNIY